MKLVINVLNFDGVVEKEHHTIKLGKVDDPAEIQVIAQEWADKLTEESWLNWEIELIDDNDMLQHTWDLDHVDTRPIFYMLTQEGYAWNSETRENIDVISHRIYKELDNG